MRADPETPPLDSPLLTTCYELELVQWKMRQGIENRDD